MPLLIDKKFKFPINHRVRFQTNLTPLIFLTLSACANHPTLHCFYSVKTNSSDTFLIMNGKNNDGDTCLVMQQSTAESLLESPLASLNNQIYCRNPASDHIQERPETLRNLYGKGYVITSIDREWVRVNDRIVPLPGWKYVISPRSQP